MIKFGSDPELFIVAEDLGVISPALLNEEGVLTWIDTDPEFRHPTYFSDEIGKIIGDGAAVEFTLKTPYNTPEEMWDALQYLRRKLGKMLAGKEYHGRKLEISTKPVEKINPEIYLPLLRNPAIWQGFIFGCDTDYDAVDASYSCKTLNVETHPYRYAGFHLHFSGSPLFDGTYENAAKAIRGLMSTVGLFFYLNTDKELNNLRKQVYGRPGRFRPQTYSSGIFGVEYRTPSSSLWEMSRVQRKALFNMAVFALTRMEKNPDYFENSAEKIAIAMNSGNTEEMRNYLRLAVA